MKSARGSVAQVTVAFALQRSPLDCEAHSEGVLDLALGGI